MLASFNHRRSVKAESRQIPQKLAARLKFVLKPHSNVAKVDKAATEVTFLKTTFVGYANQLFSEFKNKDDIIRKILKFYWFNRD